ARHCGSVATAPFVLSVAQQSRSTLSANGLLVIRSPYPVRAEPFVRDTPSLYAFDSKSPAILFLESVGRCNVRRRRIIANGVVKQPDKTRDMMHQRVQRT